MTASGNGFQETDVNDHPSVEEIAAYLSGRVSPEARAAVEAHLSGCRDCREEVTSARKLMKEQPARGHYWVFPSVAAALLLIGVLVKSPASGPTERASRSAGADGREEIVLISPRAEARLDGFVFAWRGAGPGALYALNLSDSAGNTMWESQTSDTSLTLPTSVTLSPGTLYLWYIDASTSNGLSATSGVHSFRAIR